jgi:hypothetical protein
MAGRSNGRVTFEKLQRERARQERQAEKRARRQGKTTEEPSEAEAAPAGPREKTQEEIDMETIMRLASQ